MRSGEGLLVELGEGLLVELAVHDSTKLDNHS